MSYGKMNTAIYFLETVNTADNEGFAVTEEKMIASTRAYREGRHGSQKWANLAAFSNVTDLFRFRAFPNVKITTDHILTCGDERFEIVSVEDVKGKGMYIEVLAVKIKPTNGA